MKLVIRCVIKNATFRLFQLVKYFVKKVSGPEERDEWCIQQSELKRVHNRESQVS